MKFIRKHLLLLALLCLTLIGNTAPSKQLAALYIGQYKAIAVSEMHRTGIPASIKLAQGLLESNWGRSDLASEANNHFGIKCGSSWIGQTYHKHDDDYDDKGELIASCFRAYTDSYESYIAHSDFLSDTNKEYRYGFLFDIENKDYRKWAKGLLKSGYATDKKYPSKLITIIEQYKLYEYDAIPLETESPIYVNHSEEAPSSVKLDRKEKKSTPKSKTANYAISHNNEAQVVQARGGETVKDLSKKLKINYSQIIRYNEEITTADQVLAANEYVYLSKKPKKLKKGHKVHIAKANEDMYDIAQAYGINLKNLYRINKLKSKDSITEGMQISLHDKVKKAPKSKDIASRSNSKRSKTSRKKSTRSSKKSKSNTSKDKYLFDADWADKR